MSNSGVNIEARPGLRIIKRSYGNKEVIVIEEDFMPNRSGAFNNFIAAIIFFALILIGIVAFSTQVEEPEPVNQVEYVTH